MSADSLIQDFEYLNVPVPRYTSYPTANEWQDIENGTYQILLNSDTSQEPLSIYVHIPFCHSMCLYCGCSVVLNRDPKKEERYVQALLQEIEMVAACFVSKRQVLQVHFGGGTPTKLFSHQIKTILEALKKHFFFHPDAEIAIEIDPRTVLENQFQKLIDIKEMGFNRLSFGVQDTNKEVQEAVKRRQSAELSRDTLLKARDLQFSHINVDLIYGLPLQTRATFRDTIGIISETLMPDRLALFSYAQVPWIKPHQKAIPEKWLPSVQEKFLMYLDARETLVQRGYTAIGMDHFASESDPLSHRFKTKSLKRNFQGYTILDCSTMIGFGITAISDVPSGYFQNTKSLDEYYQIIEKKQLPNRRGNIASRDDKIRKAVIHELMCHFEIEIEHIERTWNLNFNGYFAQSLQALEWYIARQYVEFLAVQSKIVVTKKGELIVRNIAACFDRFYQSAQAQTRCFSKAI